MSNVSRLGRSGSDRVPVPLPQIRPPAIENEPGGFPSPNGTAVLDLTTEQTSTIRKLLIGLRTGKTLVEDVRSGIFSLLSGGQRRVVGQAWFIISVRV
jgi:hypothetical protein